MPIDHPNRRGTPKRLPAGPAEVSFPPQPNPRMHLRSLRHRPSECGSVQHPAAICGCALHHQLHGERRADVCHSRPESLDAEHGARLFKMWHIHLPVRTSA
jgi:hypothetical protein